MMMSEYRKICDTVMMFKKEGNVCDMVILHIHTQDSLSYSTRMVRKPCSRISRIARLAAPSVRCGCRLFRVSFFHIFDNRTFPFLNLKSSYRLEYLSVVRNNSISSYDYEYDYELSLNRKEKEFSGCCFRFPQ